MKVVPEIDQFNIETLPEDVLHGILAQVSFGERYVFLQWLDACRESNAAHVTRSLERALN